MELTRLPGKNPAPSMRKTIALLGALCLFLSAVEYMIPKPFPFMRIGIANIPLMIAVDLLPFSSFLLLTGIKIFGQALISGTLFSYVFLLSLAGVTVSALCMYGLRRIFRQKRISFIGLGVTGAMVSNVSQLLLAGIFIFGESAIYLVPPFLAAGMVSGLLTGILCEYFSRRSKWYEEKRLK